MTPLDYDFLRKLLKERSGLDLSLPRTGTGRLRIVSHTGDRVRATLGGKSLDRFPVALSDQKFEFAIYPNGRIRMTDAGGTHDGHVENWHTQRGHDHAERVRRIAPRREPDVPVAYPFDRDRT